MREIKFRAWDGKVMYGVDVLAMSECTWGCPDYGKRGVSLAYQPNIAVMQYTGLEDKNGKEIYEGDIVEREGQMAPVVYEDGAFWVNGTILIHTNTPQKVEIVGNACENPELL
jgi:uncharacterized phage protein (TIGR01671 family)